MKDIKIGIDPQHNLGEFSVAEETPEGLDCIYMGEDNNADKLFGWSIACWLAKMGKQAWLIFNKEESPEFPDMDCED